MRWTDFKNIITESDSEDDDYALPSKTMVPAEISKKDKRSGNLKYLLAIGKGIDEGKTFAFATQGKPASEETKANASFGIVDKVSMIMPGGNRLEIKPKKGSKVSVGDLFAYYCEKEMEKHGAKHVVDKIRFSVGGEEFKFNQMYKTDAATGEMKINKGDAAEAILGAAITAKFEAGGKTIGVENVVELLKEVIAAGSIRRTADYDKGEGDNIEFKLSLNASSLSGIKMWMREPDPLGDPKSFQIVEKGVNPKTITDLQRQIAHAVQYANTNKRATMAVEKAKADLGKNEVQVISDGGDATQQSSTKVDLKITYDGVATRLLSLKAGSVKQFGQGSGGGWTQVSDFFESVLKFRLPDTFKEKFGFKDPAGPRDTTYLDYNYSKGPFQKLYAEMAAQAQRYTAGDNTQLEYSLVKNVYDAINFHATRGEAGVTMVILSPTSKIAYKELAFDERLLAALELYDLRVVNELGKSNHYLHVIGHLKTDEAARELGDDMKKIGTKAVLVSCRSSSNGGAIRNAVEMGDLLKELANIEKLDKDNAQDALQQAPAPKSTNDPNATI